MFQQVNPVPVAAPVQTKHTRQARVSEREIAEAFAKLRTLRDQGAHKFKKAENYISALQVLKRVDHIDMENRWSVERPTMPKARGAQAIDLCSGRGAKRTRQLLEEDGLFRQVSSFRNSIGKFVSALRCWATVCQAMRQPLGVPSKLAIRVFSTLFKNGGSLKQYFSRLRSLWKLVDFDLCALHSDETAPLVWGVRKLQEPQSRRILQAVDARQMKQLTGWLRSRGLSELADSFVVCRQFALRYQAEALSMRVSSEQSFLRFHPNEVEYVCKRKGKLELSSIFRECCCKSQDPTLCGVCVLRKRGRVPETAGGKVFPACDYRSALFWLKEAAGALGWPSPTTWGTHAFRRGWARQAWELGGVDELSAGGGWKNPKTAKGYLSARQRSKIDACDFTVNLTDSGDDSGPEDYDQD